MLKPVLLSLLMALGTLMPLQARAESIQGLPVHLEKVGSRGVRVWLGDAVSSTAVVALATSKGIVVIDTFGVPAVDTELRKLIARELGRQDFKYLINTHQHADHTFGNQVYADCTIIAHATCAEGMKEAMANRQRSVAHSNAWIQEIEAALAALPPDSAEASRKREELTLSRLNRDTLDSGLTLTLPTKTFEDRMKLKLGDTTLELFYTGGVHSNSDISILIPERGLLLTGDTMADTWFTDSPGCLASFMIRSDVKHNFPLLLENWRLIRDRKAQIQDLIPGHWNGDVSMAGFEARLNYVDVLWNEVGQWAKAGKPLEDMFAAFPLQGRFPALANSPGFSPRNHNASLLGMYQEVSGTRSAANFLRQQLTQGDATQAIKAFQTERQKNPQQFYVLEAELNMLGYSLLQGKETEQAIAVFALTAELFPASWNAFDSLAEGYRTAGNRELAIQYYRKSVTMNPSNTNGVNALKELEAGS